MFIVFIVIILLVCVGLYQLSRYKTYRLTIEEHIKSLSAEMIHYETRNIFSGTGPFKIVLKSDVVYYVKYKYDDEVKEGFVKFVELSGADWRL